MAAHQLEIYCEKRFNERILVRMLLRGNEVDFRIEQVRMELIDKCIRRKRTS